MKNVNYAPVTRRRDMIVVPREKKKDFFRRRIPIIAWLPLYTWSQCLQDALAGLTVGLTAIPQGIAYAVVAGLPPQYGLYSGFMGCFVYLIFGSCKDVTVGPTAIMALLVQPYVTKNNEDFAVLMSFLSGCVITAMGIVRLGFLVDFISMPVICGFTNAAALIIASSQIGTLLGIKGRSETFIDAIIKLFHNIKNVALWDSVLGVFCMVILVIFKHLPQNRNGTLLQKCMWLISLGRNAIVVVTGILLAYLLSINGHAPFTIIGNITGGLPPFTPPPFSTVIGNATYNFKDMFDELGASLATVPLISILESIAIAKSFAKGRSVDANQEMLALGFCNLAGSFVRSMPTTGSFTRTAVNYASGVKTPMGGIVTGGLVLLACGLLTSTFKFIPKTSLAAVIIVAMFYMLEFHIFGVLWRTKKIDVLPFAVTLVTCLVWSLDYGMAVGIVLNLLLLLYSTAKPGLKIEEKTVARTNLLLVSPQQSLSFPAAEYLRETVMSWCDGREGAIPVVVEGAHVHSIDATVAKNLRILQLDLESRSQRLVFWNWGEEAKATLTRYDNSLSRSFVTSESLETIFTDESCSQPKEICEVRTM
ncbi:sodium-independent sulfate anion transporter-like isoform X2 [Venturia canescens]|uniref:sodium-independent sulfate anion transporter-like isoform X2 n=1 Tax=Venturia canescens TaxID=32260 RepID=UPI001C9BE0CB|nr:sodium-independent sulfate anion transporter-like isoform X2 [Venturia canescens]